MGYDLQEIPLIALFDSWRALPAPQEPWSAIDISGDSKIAVFSVLERVRIEEIPDTVMLTTGPDYYFIGALPCSTYFAHPHRENKIRKSAIVGRYRID